MKPLDKMTPTELAVYVQSYLRAEGIEVVLTGGAAVSLYSHGKYVSKDLDFVVEGIARRARIRAAMAGLGFQEVGRHFEHPKTDLVIEFPGGPLSVGRQRVGKIEVLEYETGYLRVISATDCVKDRLAAFFYWNDRQALEQALMVIRSNDVDLEEISQWARQEGQEEAYRDVKDQYIIH